MATDEATPHFPRVQHDVHEFVRCEGCSSDTDKHNYCTLCQPSCPRCALRLVLANPPGGGQSSADLFQEIQRDQEDRRRLTGKYTPAPGTCRVCGGRVTAEISSERDGRLGGPPARCFVSGWSCVSCRLVYRGCPPPEGAAPL